MRNAFFKQVTVLALAAAMVVGTTSTALAGEWKRHKYYGWWYEESDGSYPTNQWKWLDKDGDGALECYYFKEDGYIATEQGENMPGINVTPDGYTVNYDGQWVVNGLVQMQGTPTKLPAGAVVNGNGIRRNLQPGETYQVSNGTWERDEKGFKFKKADGFYVYPDMDINFKYMHDPYVRDIVWMTDDDNDGTWEIYAFNEDGYLDTSISKSGWTWDFGRYGIHDTYGYLTTNYYKGAWSNMGPYQVVRRGNTWYCENGTLPDFSDACWRFTGDYSRDAFAIIGGLDHELSRMSSGSYRNVEVKEVK